MSAEVSISLDSGGLNPPTLEQQAQIRESLGIQELPLYNVTATGKPSATDDRSAGYSIGSLWVDTSGGEVYRCIVDSVGLAVWVKSTLGSLTESARAVVDGTATHDQKNAFFAQAGSEPAPRPALSGFTIPGVTPAAHIAPHLRMTNPWEVYVDYPDNITAAGNATHTEVLNAAKAMFVNSGAGNFEHGTIHLSNCGTNTSGYTIDATWVVPSRLNIIGATLSGRTGTTTISASATFVGDYLINVLQTDADSNGNFTQWITNLRIRCAGKCSGIKFAGAQSSGIRNVWMGSDNYDAGFTVYGIRIQDGSPNISIDSCQITSSNPTASACISCDSRMNGMTVTNTHVAGADVALRMSSGAVTLIGLHLEATKLFDITNSQGSLTVVGGYIKALPLEDGNHVIGTCFTGAKVSLTGILRDATAAVTGYTRDGAFIPVADMIGATANKFFPTTLKIGGEHTGITTMSNISTLASFRDWTEQVDVLNANLAADITLDGTLITVPSTHTLHRTTDPSAKIDCNYLHNQIVWSGDLDVANVGTSPLFWHAQPAFGEPPLTSSGGDTTGTQLASSLGGHPLNVADGQYASVYGQMGGRILQTSWYEDDRAVADAWQWFQAAVDACIWGITTGVVKNIQGHKHSLTLEHPINWTLRRAHYEGAGRDQSHFEISEMASLPVGWPKCAFVVHSVHVKGSSGSSGFQRRIRRGSIRDNQTDLASAVFWAGGRPEEHGEVGDWDLYEVKGFAFDFGNANGFIVDKINATSNLVGAPGVAQVFMRRRVGQGLLIVRDIWLNYEGGVMFDITGGVTYVTDVDFEGCNTLLRQSGISDDVVITNPRHGTGGANFDNTKHLLEFGFLAGQNTSTVITNITQGNFDGVKPLVKEQVMVDKAVEFAAWESAESAVVDPYMAGGPFHEFRHVTSFKRSIGWQPNYVEQPNGDRITEGVDIGNNRTYTYKLELR